MSQLLVVRPTCFSSFDLNARSFPQLIKRSSPFNCATDRFFLPLGFGLIWYDCERSVFSGLACERSVSSGFPYERSVLFWFEF
ncbi:hypothetical protein VIGAN_04028700 [Vigna angularis var. angularis]|uniref:Uncharacterized protein n=1 Tax=Vigna angularis var. angularis TaxID=157739 RepID=A0A0S3RRH8_PHAAN|nr:hypothetical protein VIGAN_04028700 [Vigna angularis var. angularis]